MIIKRNSELRISRSVVKTKNLSFVKPINCLIDSRETFIQKNQTTSQTTIESDQIIYWLQTHRLISHSRFTSNDWESFSLFH